jgi:hypothetical protein
MQDVHEAIARVDASDKAERSLEVVRELYRRYRAQDERYQNYLKLISFVGFAVLLLMVLYLQRDAHILYQVHSTIAAEVLPNPDEVSTPQDVLTWLQTLLQVSAQVFPNRAPHLTKAPHLLLMHDLQMISTSLKWSIWDDILYVLVSVKRATMFVDQLCFTV